ncbi:MAG: formate dehydrogenase subunit gamma [Betaproteobacteria bacterium]|nr:formate dehydrogenase subunit gamma [Betaproteobacteria bacterium]
MAKDIERYNESDRVNHWVIAITFVLAALSGLAFFHPSFYFLTNLFGGGPWTRILHPFIGLIMFFAFVSMAFRFAHHNKMTDSDKQWLSQWRDAANNEEHKLPPVGRYNGGQKVLFWVMVACMAILFATGLLFWQPWFAGNQPIWLVRAATLLHAVSALVLIIGVMVHIYAAIWVKGTMRGMMQGTVTDKWAKKHHPLWHKEMSEK